MPPLQPMNQPSSRMWWYVGGVVVVVLAALAIWWYFSSVQSPAATGTQTSAAEQSQAAPLSSGNTTADIQSDLNNTPNDSAALNQDQNSVNTSIQGL